MRFADKLRELRTAAGLSEAKLAEAAGVSFGAVHNYGLGIRQPTFAAVVKLARALGVTCETFADCEDIAGDAEPPGQAGAPKGRAAAGGKPKKGRKKA
jgi:putative transcriptional regulator